MRFFRKTSPRRNQVRKGKAAGESGQMGWLADTDRLSSVVLGLVFIILCICVLSFELIRQ